MKRLRLKDLLLNHDLGLIRFRDLDTVQPCRFYGRKFALRTNIRFADPEDARFKTSPRRYKIFEIVKQPNSTTMWQASVDIDGLNQHERELIHRHCGSIVTCDATVYGRVGEIREQRTVNAFVQPPIFTAVIGIVADHIVFHVAPLDP